MSGRTHGTRSPSRIRDIIGRDASSYVSRQTVASQDLRKAIYYSPHGKGYHKVQNPFSGEVYVVADGLGGSTVTPGAVVMVASFSGQHGEVLISRPPAGFGGSSVTRVTRPPDDIPVTVNVVLTGQTHLSMAYDAGGNRMLLARIASYVTGGVVTTYKFQVVSILRSLMPHVDVNLETVLWEEDAEWMDGYSVRWMTVMSGSRRIAMLYTKNEDGATGTKMHYAVAISATGHEIIRTSCDRKDGAPGFASCANDGSNIYSLEPRTSGTNSASPPYLPDMQVVKRSVSTMGITVSYLWPNTSPFDGRTTRGWDFGGLLYSGGSLYVHFGHIRQPDLNVKTYYRPFSTALSASADVATDFWSAGGWGFPSENGGQKVMFANGEFSAVTLAAYVSTLNASVTGTGNFDLLVAIDGGDFAILSANGSPFITSILQANGTQLVP